MTVNHITQDISAAECMCNSGIVANLKMSNEPC
jgi:hypothetical protein